MSGGNAASESFAMPLANRMSVRISTSTQVECRRTAIMSAATSGASAFSISSATRPSAGGTMTLPSGSSLSVFLRPPVASLRVDRDRFEHLARLPVQRRLLNDRHGDVGARSARLLAHVDRLERPRRAAECRLQRIGQHAELALVDRRERVHDHEESQQQRDEVAVGNGPRFVIGVVFVFVLSSHGAAHFRRVRPPVPEQWC